MQQKQKNYLLQLFEFIDQKRHPFLHVFGFIL